MVLGDALECLGLDPTDPAAAGLYRSLARSDPGPAPRDWRVLAAAVARKLMPVAARAHGVEPEPDAAWPAWDQVGGPLVVGLSGGQGAGKSTLAAQLQRALELAGARAVVLALDDFYLSRRERQDLAASVHPLLAVRGVPGTHDVALLQQVLSELGRTGGVRVPRFDKGADDVLPPDEWRGLAAPADVVVLEGWCVGARAEAPEALTDPCNELEAVEDASGRWRRHVNAQLAGPYADLWRRLHVLIYLQVPDLDAVVRWRGEQERALPAANRMNDDRLLRFIAHYQRITDAMQAEVPARADLTVRLDERHRVASLRRGRAGSRGPD